MIQNETYMWNKRTAMSSTIIKEYSLFVMLMTANYQHERHTLNRGALKFVGVFRIKPNPYLREKIHGFEKPTENFERLIRQA